MEIVKGSIFNIQHYSIHDGPGIRTTVFMKGCPLRCFWCQNPESQAFHSELFYNRDQCSGCGRCISSCPEKAIEVYEGRSKTNRKLCQACGACTHLCLEEARILIGKIASAEDVFREVYKDAIFYQKSGGGVTLSGGEPLAQTEFAIGILRWCKDSGIHTAIDTCGYAPWENMERVLKYVDLILYDLKHMDPIKHERTTGVSNHLILDNIKKIYQHFRIPLIIRIPIIPGYNDHLSNIETTASFITKELTPSIPVHLIPYHKFGESKHEQLEEPQQCLEIEVPDERYLQELKRAFNSLELQVSVGG